MTTGSRKPNDFCWINLMSPQGEKGRTFFASLFGWAYDDMGLPGGQLIMVDGHPIGAFMDLDVVQMPPTPPVIGAMIKATNADEMAAKVKANGGTAAVHDVGTNGRMGMCTDPNGAIFALWQPLSKDGATGDSHAHGAATWFETLTTDTARAKTFYTQVFGWTSEDQAMPNMTYTTFKLDGVPIAGAMAITKDMGPMPAHWGVYFAVKDADAIAERATELGGAVCMPPMDIQGVGRFAMLRSPQGVNFYVITYAIGFAAS